MTDIEARRILIQDMKSLKANPLVTVDDCLYEAFDKAINALGQGDVLDNIRAEIEEQVLESLSDGGDDWFAAEKVNECLEIIDKYKTESEDKE